jgi:hypothetical protein
MYAKLLLHVKGKFLMLATVYILLTEFQAADIFRPPHKGPTGTLVNMFISQHRALFPREMHKGDGNIKPKRKEVRWGPCAQGSELQRNDRPVLGCFLS